MDVRLTGCGRDVDMTIQQAIKKNRLQKVDLQHSPLHQEVQVLHLEVKRQRKKKRNILTRNYEFTR